jgi:hypothetical protein
VKRGDVPLTRDQLQVAYRQLFRPGWPATLEDVLLDPLRGPLVKGMARSMSRAAFRLQMVQHRLPTAPVPTTPTAPPAKQGQFVARGGRWSNNQPIFDVRKAAANDLKD